MTIYVAATERRGAHGSRVYQGGPLSLTPESGAVARRQAFETRVRMWTHPGSSAVAPAQKQERIERTWGLVVYSGSWYKICTVIDDSCQISRGDRPILEQDRIKRSDTATNVDQVTIQMGEPVTEDETMTCVAFPGAFYVDDLKTRIVRDYLVVVRSSSHTVERILYRADSASNDEATSYRIFRDALREVAREYVYPDYDIVVAQGDLRLLRDALPDARGWEGVEPEEVLA